jgi:hypothetical protein
LLIFDCRLKAGGVRAQGDFIQQSTIINQQSKIPTSRKSGEAWGAQILV